MVATKAGIDVEYATIPDAAPLVPLKVDRLRMLIRRKEQALLAAGIIMVAGGRRLVRTDRLDGLREVLGLK